MNRDVCSYPSVAKCIFLISCFPQKSHSDESPDRRRKDDRHRRSSAQSDGSINGNTQELSEDELEKQRAQLLRELQMQQEEN